MYVCRLGDVCMLRCDQWEKEGVYMCVDATVCMDERVCEFSVQGKELGQICLNNSEW